MGSIVYYITETSIRLEYQSGIVGNSPTAPDPISPKSHYVKCSKAQLGFISSKTIKLPKVSTHYANKTNKNRHMD